MPVTIQRRPPTAREALEAVLLFYSPPPWDEAKQIVWKRITGEQDCCSKVLCDAVRAALASIP